MKILHLAAGNRWTGAAAPAFAEAEALRDAGLDAHYAYVGGYKLEAKLAGCPFAHALIEKAQNPASFARTVRAIRDFVLAHDIDIVHTHLTYDHWLARFAVRGTRARMFRTFHSRRVIRRDPLTRSILRKTHGIAVINATFARLLPDRNVVFTPPPLDRRAFTPDGPTARSLYGIRQDERIVAVIGKLSKGRGFEEALRTFSVLRRSQSDVRLMIIGHGEHRHALETLSRDLGIAPFVIWAGYHETDLAEHYRAADALVFTAAGSDEGHRAVLEAMACGLPPVTYPVAGIEALVPGEQIAPIPKPERLSAILDSVLGPEHTRYRAASLHRAPEFEYPAAAERLIRLYRDLKHVAGDRDRP